MGYGTGVISHFRVKKKFKLIKRYITPVITHNRCNICFYPIFLHRALTLHSRYYKFSCSRVHFASSNVAANSVATVAASTSPYVASLIFRSLRHKSILTEWDSPVHAFLLFRFHSCCLCRRHIASIVTTTLFTFTL